MIPSPTTDVSNRLSCTLRGKLGHSASAARPNKRSNSNAELFFIVSDLFPSERFPSLVYLITIGVAAIIFPR